MNGPIVRCDALTKVYAPNTPIEVRALDNVDVTIAQGEHVAVVGESGSGKTTLMHLLGGLDRPTSGTVTIGDTRLDRASSAALAGIRARRIGFVFQGANLIPTLNALDNVLLAARYARTPRKAARERARTLLADLGLAARMHHRPDELSGGQQQRVAIARALVNEPTIVLADEPTGNLDSGTAESILDLFSALHQQGQTLIIVTHSAAVYGRAQRIIRIADGKIVP